MLRIASRKSPLALVQIEEIMRALPGVPFEHVGVDTFGDLNREISLWSNTKEDFFSDEVDRALLDGKADIAVHSAKDLPYPLPSGLELIALTAARDQTDSLVSRANEKLLNLPPGSRIGTSSIDRKRQVLALRPDLEMVSIRGNIEERIELIESNKVDAIIVATCALERLGLLHYSAEILPFATHPLQGHLALLARTDRTDMTALFQPYDIRWTFGRVWLVGAGPGDPELLTFKAHRILSQAEAIYYDALIAPELLKSYSGEKIFVGKRKGEHEKEQDEINELLYQTARKGKRTVRLKGGDPLLFSRGGEEIEYLQRRFISVEVVPGISSAQGSAASLRVPLTRRGISDSVTFLSGHAAPLPDTASADNTRVFFMGISRKGEIAQELMAEGSDSQTPCAVVSNASRPGEQTVITRLENLGEANSLMPGIIITGRVLQNARQRPRLLYTGLDPSGFRFPGEVVHYPLIRTEGIVADKKPGACDALVFTSKSAVSYFFERFLFPNLTAFAIGRPTEQVLRSRGLNDVRTPEFPNADSLARLVEKSEFKSLLYPCSDLSGNAVMQISKVSPLVLYRTKLVAQDRIDLSSFSAILFASPSCVKSFIAIYGGIPDWPVLYVYGPATLTALTKAGVQKDRIVTVPVNHQSGQVV